MIMFTDFLNQCVLNGTFQNDIHEALDGKLDMDSIVPAVHDFISQNVKEGDTVESFLNENLDTIVSRYFGDNELVKSVGEEFIKHLVEQELPHDYEVSSKEQFPLPE